MERHQHRDHVEEYLRAGGGETDTTKTGYTPKPSSMLREGETVRAPADVLHVLGLPPLLAAAVGLLSTPPPIPTLSPWRRAAWEGRELGSSQNATAKLC